MFRSATLALFNRSLREDTRRATPYFARMGLAALILLFLGMAHMSSGLQRSSTAGLTFFTMVIWINVVFFTVVGLSHFSSAITEEKEDMALGLLRMTNLNPLSILLGKSTNRLFVALLYLLAQFPFTLLAVTLGGVSTSQVVAAYGALAAYIVLLANLGLFFSVLCRRTYTAAFLSFISLVVSAVIIWIVYAVVQMLLGAGLLLDPDSLEARLPGMLAECTVAFRLADVLSTGFAGGPLCSQVVSNVAAALVLFLASWLTFDSATRNQLGVDAGPARPLTSARSVPGRRRLFAPTRPGMRAVFWKDRHFLHNGKTGLLWRLLALAALFFGVIPGIAYMMESKFWAEPVSFDRFTRTMSGYGFFVFWISLFLAVLQLWLLAGRIFREEIRWQTLSSLAMLPTSMRRIAYQKVAAALTVVLPIVAFLVIGLLMEMDDFMDFLAGVLSGNGEESVAFFCGIFYAIGQVVLGTHLIAWLSIQLKWGAFALGVFAIVIGNMAYGMLSVVTIDATTGGIAMLFIGGLAAFAASVGLHEAIGLGLKSSAAKE
ncbi:MAG: hypothetical protein KDN22_03690 [Verrucomicrobiae bacterium]|nr:hypothetical protein [Verrucomicrobiae bacterium]